jgi:hypothetical protein
MNAVITSEIGLISAWSFDNDAYDSSGSNHGFVTGNALFVLSDAPLGPDSDGDGLLDSNEIILGTDPWDIDTDDDGLSDFEEYVEDDDLDPLNPDSDGDGIQDGTEMGLIQGYTGNPWLGIKGTDYSFFIVDQDPSTTTDPLDDDCDDDGIMDGTEDRNGDGKIRNNELNPNDWDSDNDHISDGIELGYAAPEGLDTDMALFQPDADPLTTTRPLRKDSDGGGLEDHIEDWNRNGKIDPGESDPNDASDDLQLLTIDPIVEGGEATFHFFGCPPDSWIYLCFSFDGVGPSPIGNAGIIMDLTQPIHVRRPIAADSRGRAVNGPNNLPAGIVAGTQLWFQGLTYSPIGAVQQDVTNMVPVTVQ